MGATKLHIIIVSSLVKISVEHNNMQQCHNFALLQKITQNPPTNNLNTNILIFIKRTIYIERIIKTKELLLF